MCGQTGNSCNWFLFVMMNFQSLWWIYGCSRWKFKEIYPTFHLEISFEWVLVLTPRILRVFSVFWATLNIITKLLEIGYIFSTATCIACGLKSLHYERSSWIIFVWNWVYSTVARSVKTNITNWQLLWNIHFLFLFFMIQIYLCVCVCENKLWMKWCIREISERLQRKDECITDGLNNILLIKYSSYSFSEIVIWIRIFGFYFLLFK